MADRGRIARNTAFLSLAHGASKFFSILLTMFATRILGAAGYGLYTAGNTFIEVGRVLAGGGLDYLVTREVADDLRDTTRVASAAAAVKSLLSAVAYGLVLLAVWKLHYPTPVLQVVLILGTIVFLENISDIADAVFQGAQRMDYITRTMLVSSASIFVFATAALLLGLGILGFVTGIALGCLVRTLVGTTFLRRNFGRLSVREVENDEVRRLMRAAVPLMGATVLSLLFHRIDILMLSRMVDARYWGYYGVAVRVIDVVVLAPRILATAVYPQLRLACEKGEAPAVSLITGGTRVTLVFCSALAITVWIFAPLIVRVMAGDAFAPAVGALRILAWAIALQAGCHMMVRLLFAADRERDLLPIGALGIVANVILNALLIPRMGIEGAAVATLVSYGLTLALYFFYARRAGFRVPVWTSAGGALLALAAAIAVTVLLKERALWVRASASALTWLVVLTVLRVNGLRELQEALRLLRKR